MVLVESARSSDELLVLNGVLPHVAPDRLFRYFVEPARLVEWWPEEAETNPVEGGDYQLRWPSMEWTLGGTYLHVEPPRRLNFTWRWHHEPHLPERTVDIRLDAVSGGTELVIAHGRYGPADLEERRSHLDGWQFFVAKLSEVSG